MLGYWSPQKSFFSKCLPHFTLSLQTCLCRGHCGPLWFSWPGWSALHWHCNTCHLPSSDCCLWGISRWHAELGPRQLLPPAEISQWCHLQQAEKVRAMGLQLTYGHSAQECRSQLKIAMFILKKLFWDRSQFISLSMVSLLSYFTPLTPIAASLRGGIHLLDVPFFC